MTPNTKTLKLIGYPAYFIFCSVCFGYCTFPYERVREKVRVALEESFNADVQIQELSPSWVTGVEVTGVEIKTRPTRPGDVPTTFQIDSLTARVGLLALLTGGLDISYAVEIYGGEIEGTFSQDGANATASVQFDGLDLSKVQTLRTAIGLPLAGLVSGDANLTLIEQSMAKADGAIHLRTNGVKVGDGHAKLEIPGFGGLTIDPIEVGELQAEMLVKAGKATVTRLAAQGRDLELIGEGRIDLRDPLPMSSVQSYVRFKINPGYSKRNQRMEPLVGGLDLMPSTKRAKRPDGFFGYRVSGTFARGLSFLPTARAPPGPRSRVSPGAIPPGPRARDVAEPSDDADLDVAGPPQPGIIDEQNLGP